MQFGTYIIYNANFIIKQDNFKTFLEKSVFCMHDIYNIPKICFSSHQNFLFTSDVCFVFNSNCTSFLFYHRNEIICLKKYTVLISLSIWAMQKVFPLRPESMNSSIIPISLMKSSRQVIH